MKNWIKSLFVVLCGMMIATSFTACGGSNDDNDDNNKKGSLCPDSNHPHMINLGLPSGTLWACCNVGAYNPEQKGAFYAWGESETKSYFEWDNYKYGNLDNLQYIGSDISGTIYDTALSKWGGSWVMPTFDQCQELVNYTTYSPITSGTYGVKIVGPNGNAIFLPTPGDDDGNYKNELGDYWTSSIKGLSSSSKASQASILSVTIDYGINVNNNSGRAYGALIRPVTRQSGYWNPDDSGNDWGPGGDSGQKCKYCLGYTDCRNYFYSPNDKYYCHGSRKCQWCGGDGWQDGMFGSGPNSIACSACNTPGSGNVGGDGKCGYCGGTGICHHCHGKGIEP